MLPNPWRGWTLRREEGGGWSDYGEWGAGSELEDGTHLV